MKKILLSILVLSNLASAAQKIATFEVELPKATNGLSLPVSVNLDELTFLPDSSLGLSEISGNTINIIPFQITTGEHRIMHWSVQYESGQLKKRIYELWRSTNVKDDESKNFIGDGKMIFQSSHKNLLQYNFGTVYPPAGIDSSYRRSGFIHPLWTPHGQILTNIQPKDHYHHYGIWNPWTHTVFEKDTVDFWNIGGRKGTVRFARFISQTNGPIFSEIEALHEHVVFKSDGTEKVALNELQTIRVYKPEENADYYIVDVTSKLSCATQSPLLIVAYRYGGFGWRATPEWTKDNCEVLTSEGTNRKNTDGIKARWIITQGTLGNDYGGLVMLSYPANYNHPEPLRIWDENANGGRGDMFANFAPTKDKDWLLEPGKTYTLKYRLLVFSGKMNKEKAESSWQYFAKPPGVKVK